MTNKIYSALRISCYLLLFTPIVTCAQIMSDIKVEPQPYLFPPYYDEIAITPVKEVIFITRLDVDRKLNSDTIWRYSYDKEKRKSRMIRYEKNKPANIYHNNYTGKNLIETWEAPVLAQADGLMKVLHKFNKNGNKTYTRGFTLLKKDTISWNFHAYTYDKANRLVKKISNTNNSWITRDDYYYDKGRLTKHDHIQNPKSPFLIQVLYRYNPQGLLSDKEEFEVRDSSKYLIYYRRYTYKNRKLVKEDYTMASQTEQTTVRYTYNENGKLKEMRITKADLYKNVTYHYRNNQLDKINVETNAWTGLNGEFYIPLSNSINSSTKVPIFYEEQFLYDNRGSLIEKKILLNGEVKRINDFKIEYY